jgi:hypothetical protein
VGGAELAGEAQVAGLDEGARDLLRLLGTGDFGDHLADALGPAAERAADRAQGGGGWRGVVLAIVAAVGHAGSGVGAR